VVQYRNNETRKGCTMSSKKTTDKTEIRKILHSYMLAPNEQRANFLVAIFTREHRAGGTIYEGARPLSACTYEDGDTRYTLTNGDSNYTEPVASVKLSFIEYVEELV
jgi:hypothetical protein